MDRNRGGRPRHPDVLTPAEWRVLEEMREGGTNAEIAVRLGISPDTVKYHVSNMLAKLGVQNRRELAAWRPEPEAKRRRLRAVLAIPAALGPVVRPLGWVAIGAAALGVVAVVTVALVVLAGNGDQPVVVAPPPAESPEPSPPPTPTPTPTPPPPATQTPEPQATPTPTPEPPPDPTPRPVPAAAATPEATPSPAQVPADQSEAATFRYDAFGTAPPVTIRTVLQPGLNLAGWTEPDANVSAIFDALPELASVYAWDPEEQWPRWAARTDTGIAGDLKTLTPGMGLWLDIAGDRSATWERPLIPQSGLAELREGWNLIVWAGDDGIATSVAIRHLDEIVAATLDASGASPATLARGEAFWLRASADKQWWQLDPPPRVEFLRPYSSWEKETFQASLDDVVTYFARRFGLGVPGLTVRFGDVSIKSSGAYANDTVALRPGCEVICLAHEYAHAIQDRLGGFAGPNPAWIYEGVANRWSSQYDEVAGGQSYADTLRGRVVRFSRDADALLQRMETYGEQLSYQVGEMAIDWLVGRAGEDALIRYFSRRPLHEDWQDLFLEAFGITASAFYERFEDYRREIAPPFPRVSGVVVGPQGRPVEGVTLLYRDFAGRDMYTFVAWTDVEGAFEGPVATGSFRLSLEFDDCSLGWSSTDGRIELLGENTARLEVGQAGLEGLVFVLSDPFSQQCQGIEGIVTDLAGNPRSGVVIFAFPGLGASPGSPGDSTGVRGNFAITVPDGPRWLLVRTAVGDGYYGGETGFTLERPRVRLVDGKSPDRSGIVIPYGIIRGTVLGSDGEPLEGVAVYTPLHNPPGGRAPLRTDSQGDFALAVPSGAHKLELECRWSDRGGWYGGERGFTTREREAEPVVLETADVEGIVIHVPFTQADVDARTCPFKAFDIPQVRGVVLDTTGEPRRGLRLKLTDLDLAITSQERTTFTSAEGAFVFQEFSFPDHLFLWLRPETSCVPGLAEDGEWIAIGLQRGGGRFVVSADLPAGMTVQAPGAEGLVIRIPAPCP